MSKTREELVERVLIELGVASAGQVANAEDSAIIDAAIEPVLSDLSARGIYSFGDPDSYDDEAFDQLAMCIANSRAKAFGGQYSEETRRVAESRLRLLTQVYLSGQPVRVEYF